MRLTDDKVLMLADTIRANFDMAIMDLPRHFIMREPALFSRFDDIVIVSELTLQSLRDANRLAKLMGVRNRQAKVHVIANQVAARPDVTVKEFEAGMEAPAALRLPARPQGHGEDDAEGSAADHRRRQAQDRHRPAPVLHRARRRAGGGQVRSRLLPAPGKEEVSAPWKTDWRVGITAGSDPLSALRLAASDRLRQALGAEGLAKASPMQLAERANDVLESLVAAHAIKPSLGDQRQLLRDVVETLRLERTAAAPAPVETPGPPPTRSTTPSPRAPPRTHPRPRTSARCRSRPRSCRC